MSEEQNREWAMEQERVKIVGREIDRKITKLQKNTGKLEQTY